VSSIPERIGHFEIRSKLGEGGMGIVYAAEDQRLGRSVAIKVVRPEGTDPAAHKRLWREARAAAAVNHPNICQLYEIGEDDGQLFIAMELLEGESLEAKLEGGPLPPSEALPLTLTILVALETLHDHDIVHRDLKPSNVFLSSQGLKILDFGLARAIPGCDLSSLSGDTLTMPGVVAGTPAYMAPERLLGHPFDERADLFSVSVLLFEMLAGRPPFVGSTMEEIVHAILRDRPPVLTGPTPIPALAGVINRGLEKAPADRYETAGEMANELRAITRLTDSGEVPRPRVVSRLIVLPFRMLRPDSEAEFLAISLPEAITGSLSGLDSLLVRSTLAGMRFSSDAPDLKVIADEADVDAVLTGTLLRADDELRVSAQLVEAPSGTVLWSQATQVAFGGLFELQDDHSRRIVESLAIPLSMREQQLLGRDIPASARAYEFYLRGNQLGYSRSSWETARDLYLESVAEDSQFAPAWARLGRIYRLMANWGDPAAASDNLERAAEAFDRALKINPDLRLAHSLCAYLEIDRGHPELGMVRLVKTAKKQRADPELFAGLVHACRYCGLLDASLAAHEKAQRLDPNVRTSVCQTFAMLGDFSRAVETERTDEPLMGIVLRLHEGRETEVIEKLKGLDASSLGHHLPGARAFLAALEGRHDEFNATLEEETQHILDPEHLYYWSLMAAYVGQVDQALETLRKAVNGGFSCHSAVLQELWLEPARGDPRFAEIVATAEARHLAAATAFREAGGDRLLNL
jgi:serine/threonine protein kinase